MEASNSLELDDAIFPQPPQDVSTVGNLLYSGAIIADTNTKLAEFKSEDRIDSLPEILKEQKLDEGLAPVSLDNDQDNEDKQTKTVKKKEIKKKQSTIRRLLNGIRLKKNQSDSSSEDDDDDDDTSSKEDDSDKVLAENEESGCSGDEPAANKMVIARMFYRVQSKANRMWEQLGQKFGGRADTDIDETTDESSREPSLSLSEIKKDDNSFEDDANTLVVEKASPDIICQGDAPEIPVVDISVKTELPDDIRTQSSVKTNTLRRLASGLKNGFLPNKQKTKQK